MIIVKSYYIFVLFIMAIIALNWLPVADGRAGTLAGAPLAAMASCGNAIRQGLSGALAAGGEHISRAGKSFGVAPACRIDLKHAR